MDLDSETPTAFIVDAKEVSLVRQRVNVTATGGIHCLSGSGKSSKEREDAANFHRNGINRPFEGF